MVPLETYRISADLWDFIFHVAIQRNHRTDKIPDVYTIPPNVTEHWILACLKYFGCRAFGNRRFEFVKQDDHWKSFSMVLRTTKVLEDDIVRYIQKQPPQTNGVLYSATDILAEEAQRLMVNPEVDVWNPIRNSGNKALYHLWSKCNVSDVNSVVVLPQLIDIVIRYENENPPTQTMSDTPWKIVLELAVTVQYTQTIQVPNLVIQSWMVSKKYSMVVERLGINGM